ncbi:DNA polymerase III subunit delta' [candidate division KSB1 bacterium]|nr:DNA polymerase III subunit delta' [candidate division KSB1 bacterium]
MSFAQIIGQSRVKEIIQRALRNQRVPHAYLFNGPDGVGKEACAIEFVKAIFCASDEDRPCDGCSGCQRVAQFNHPDFFFIFPLPKRATPQEEREVLDGTAKNPYDRPRPWASPSIGIDRIRELRRASNLRPLEGHRVVVIAEADRMTPEAANALLKILEEPPEAMHLVLTTAQMNALLPTIVSRCQDVRFGLLTDDEIAATLQQRQCLRPDEARLIASIAQGSYRRALAWLQQSLHERREQSVEFLRHCMKDEIFYADWVENLMQKFDKTEIRDLLSLIAIWFRDAMALRIVQEGQSDQPPVLVNIDKADTLQKFIAAFDEIHFHQAIGLLENAIQMMDRNIQLNLILIVLMSRLRGCLVKKR